MIKHGTKREDGKVFWGYHKLAKNGEEWVTEASFRKRKAKSFARQWMKRRRRNHWLEMIKLNSGCKHCGFDDEAIALDFHHTGFDKVFNISDGRGNSLKKLMHEIRKCIVLCKNCHAVETARGVHR